MRKDQWGCGSTVVASMEGTRPVLVEIQALISLLVLENPRRMATGIDHNRVSLIMAVLEKNRLIIAKSGRIFKSSRWFEVR